MELPNIGERIKKARLDKGLTQEQLANILGTTKAAISRYESQKREPRIGQLIAISKALGISLSNLQGIDEDTETVIVQKLKSGELQEDDTITVGPDGNIYMAKWSADDPMIAEHYNQRVTEKNIKRVYQMLAEKVYPCSDADEEYLCKIVASYASLNGAGKHKAVERVEELTEIPKYQK